MNLPKNGKFTAKYALFRHFTMECTVAGICTTLIPQLHLQVRIATPIASAYCNCNCKCVLQRQLQVRIATLCNAIILASIIVLRPHYIPRYRLLISFIGSFLILAISTQCVGVVSQRVRLPALALRLLGSIIVVITRAASCSISSCRVRR